MCFGWVVLHVVCSLFISEVADDGGDNDYENDDSRTESFSPLADSKFICARIALMLLLLLHFDDFLHLIVCIVSVSVN